MSLNKLGDLAIMRGDLHAAVALYNRSLAVRRRIVQQQAGCSATGRARHELDLAVSLGKLADAEQVRGLCWHGACRWTEVQRCMMQSSAPACTARTVHKPLQLMHVYGHKQKAVESSVVVAVRLTG